MSKEESSPMSTESAASGLSKATLQTFANKTDEPSNILKADEYTKGLNQEHIKKLTQEAYKRFIDYTNAELKLTVDDCQLLEEMNKATKEKYTQINQMTQHLTKEMSKLQKSYNEFNHFIQQVEDIHEKSVQMERTAKALDEYSQYLEAKLVNLRPTTSTATSSPRKR
ncbi:biogenesis of lysosome-related organelles complex-1 subunit 2-domain-containing protein [Mycotypha africana]|uniref:biogenesis of lysosome-related organelles complex-1 subunit 2-domain-containing protein n=1 Tax=Mycotypha africana TaxID=64632 RepID=UPI002301B3F5|nr:biogenesis of lysosome-related organelles complex-1 subunit 2-domain-containing protein [Mycotypha africana]KAI8987559.1 biogenesis of lysosome-related organelles complex-1 subunit 2-domain-containing protein [Mycotypha africana]